MLRRPGKAGSPLSLSTPPSLVTLTRALLPLVGLVAAGFVPTSALANPNLVPVHSYELDGTLEDSLGGPDLQSEGGLIGEFSY
jgi:hypothetical protein